MMIDDNDVVDNVTLQYHANDDEDVVLMMMMTTYQFHDYDQDEILGQSHGEGQAKPMMAKIQPQIFCPNSIWHLKDFAQWILASQTFFTLNIWHLKYLHLKGSTS